MASNAKLPGHYKSQYFPSIGKQLYLNEERADVHFVFDDDNGQIAHIPAHKILLTGANEVFCTMFNGSWDENSEVKIVDASEDGFKEFLQFFYFTDIELTMENIGEVMYLGKKYNVAECLTLCTKFLRNTLNEDNICQGLELAIKFDQEDLKNFCEAMIMLNTKAVFASDGFLKCDRKVLSQIVKLNSLSCTEMELFEACVSRVEADDKERSLNEDFPQIEVKNLLKELRFGSMSFEELTTITSKYHNHISYEEHRDIFQMALSKEFQPTLVSGLRDKRIDSVPWDNNDIIRSKRLKSHYSSIMQYLIKEEETTTFSTNQPILLRGFGCTIIFLNEELKRLENNLPFEFTVVEVAAPTYSIDEIILYNGQSHIESEDFTVISLKKPILIKAGFTYGIRIINSKMIQ